MMMTDDTTRSDTADDDAKPGDEGALFLRLKAWHKESVQHLGEWRTEAKEDYSFVAGDQWAEEDRAKLLEEMRAPVTFNRVGAVVDSVAGMEVGNRQEVKYYGREIAPDDAGKGEMLSNAAKFFRDECDAEDEESDAFWDEIVCGLGATETRVDFEDDPEGALPIDRLDPLCVWYDPTAKKRNLADRRFCGYDKEIPIQDAREMFPDAEDEDLHAGWAAVHSTDEKPHDATPQLAYKQDGDGLKEQSDRKRVTVVYVEWWDRESYYRVVDETSGQSAELPPGKYKTLLERAAKAGLQIKGAKATRKVHKFAFLGRKVLETGPARCKYGFSINFMTGKRDRNKRVYYGLLRNLKDPQRWGNKLFTQMLHMMNASAKGAPMAEKTAFVNPRDAEKDWADPTKIVWMKDGALKDTRVVPRNPAQMPPAIDKLLTLAITAIPQVTGVNFELMGMAERDQPGILEYQRKQAGMTILATLFDSLRRYRKEQGRVYLHLIQEYIPAGRLIRIDSNQGPKYAPLIKDPQQTKYDVIVDEAPSSPNQKEAAWAALQPMMPMLEAAPPQILAEVIKMSPLPESVAEKIAQMLMQMGQQQVPPQVQKSIELLQKQLQQLTQEREGLQQQIQQLKMDNTADAIKAQSDAAVAQQKANNDMAIAQAQMELERQKAEIEIAIKAKELELKQATAQVDLHVKRETANAQIEMKRQEVDAHKETAREGMALEREKAENSQDIERQKVGLKPKKQTKPAKKKYRITRDKATGDIAEIDAEEVA